jgi:basic amino acid/polyamine antiporter, APA family
VAVLERSKRLRKELGLISVIAIAESAEWIANEFLEGTKVGATPVSQGIALPHLRHASIQRPHLAIARVASAVTPADDDETWGRHAPDGPIRALFFLASPASDPAQHLRMLAMIARHAEDEGFMDRFLAADGGAEVKHVLLSPSEAPP